MPPCTLSCGPWACCRDFETTNPRSFARQSRVARDQSEPSLFRRIWGSMGLIGRMDPNLSVFELLIEASDNPDLVEDDQELFDETLNEILCL